LKTDRQEIIAAIKAQIPNSEFEWLKVLINQGRLRFGLNDNPGESQNDFSL
jgi:hypothetical protein